MDHFVRGPSGKSSTSVTTDSWVWLLQPWMAAFLNPWENITVWFSTECLGQCKSKRQSLTNSAFWPPSPPSLLWDLRRNSETRMAPSSTLFHMHKVQVVQCGVLSCSPKSCGIYQPQISVASSKVYFSVTLYVPAGMTLLHIYLYQGPGWSSNPHLEHSCGRGKISMTFKVPN